MIRNLTYCFNRIFQIDGKDTNDSQNGKEVSVVSI
jgi:hypothetical protein